MTRTTRIRSAAAALVAAIMIGLPTLSGASAELAADAVAASRQRPAVIGVRVIGHSVNGRSIYAYRAGERGADTTVVVIAAMHGNELAAQRIVQTLRDGYPISGVDLWLIPTYNRDGAIRHDRQNARGVDLNRNYPRHWRPLTGNYYSGPRPASEPETRAMMRFLDRIDPDYVVSFHQPLRGLDVRDAKEPRFGRQLAENLRLPLRHIDCSGVCHSKMTPWFNARHEGFAITVELGYSPSARYLTKVGPRGLLRTFGATRDAPPR
ncbi:MAG: M14 family zinc carboxypeptidase [Nocardioidaceae bacterium]